MAIESKMSGGSGSGFAGNRSPLPPRSPFSGEQKKFNLIGWIWLILFIAITIGIGWYFTKFQKNDVLSELQSSSQPTDVATGEYQAVFLDNGQTYFGKLDSKSGEFLNLTDVFYLQANTAANSPQGGLALSKLGTEAHAPEDKMSINKSHVLFIENLKSDSKVVQAIQQYKSK